ncbi:MAG: hypothetical protein AB7G15_14995, partial [Alphaproteobacteria bacterium]
YNTKPLSDDLLYGNLVKGGLVKIGLGEDKKLTYAYVENKNPKPTDGEDGSDGDESKTPALAD